MKFKKDSLNNKKKVLRALKRTKIIIFYFQAFKKIKTLKKFLTVVTMISLFNNPKTN